MDNINTTSTVTTVVTERGFTSWGARTISYRVDVSCGHNFNLATLGQPPAVGDRHDCMTCTLRVYQARMRAARNARRRELYAIRAISRVAVS